MYLILDFKPQCVRSPNQLWATIFSCSFLFTISDLFYPPLISSSSFSPPFLTTRSLPFPCCVLYSMSACQSISLCLVRCLAAWVCFFISALRLVSLPLFSASLKSSFTYVSSCCLLCFHYFLSLFWPLHPNKHFDIESKYFPCFSLLCICKILTFLHIAFLWNCTQICRMVEENIRVTANSSMSLMSNACWDASLFLFCRIMLFHSIALAYCTHAPPCLCQCKKYMHL